VVANRGLHFSVCVTSVAHTFLVLGGKYGRKNYCKKRKDGGKKIICFYFDFNGLNYRYVFHALFDCDGLCN
jgi:hypothetical protein